MFSDVQDNTQYRLLWDNRRVTAIRKPSNNSNGNSFDFQGRQLSTQDFFRRVVRWEVSESAAAAAAGVGGESGGRLTDVEDRLLGLETQVSELAERLDFAERLLAQARERGAVPKG